MTMPNFLIIGAEKARTNFCVFEGQKFYRQLTAVFRQDILQLQDLIGRDLSPWLKQTELNQ